MEIRRFDDIDAFAAHAQPWLMQREAEHNLLLGITDQVRHGTHEYQPPLYFATVEQEQQVCGCVFRTPPYPLGLTRMPPAALPCVVEDLSALYTELPAAHGPEQIVTHFGRQWVERHGGDTRIEMRQRIYQLESVQWPPHRAPGSMRLAASTDLTVAYAWAEAFAIDTGVPLGDDQRGVVDRLTAAGDLFLWTADSEVVSMAAAVGPTPNGVRVGYVYTPPAARGRGYASALVATMSQRLLDAGRRFCFLYTDTDNPTSNAIYRRLGYEPVCEVTLVGFTARPGVSTGSART